MFFIIIYIITYIMKGIFPSCSNQKVSPRCVYPSVFPHPGKSPGVLVELSLCGFASDTLTPSLGHKVKKVWRSRPTVFPASLPSSAYFLLLISPFFSSSFSPFTLSSLLSPYLCPPPPLSSPPFLASYSLCHSWSLLLFGPLCQTCEHSWEGWRVG